MGHLGRWLTTQVLRLPPRMAWPRKSELGPQNLDVRLYLLCRMCCLATGIFCSLLHVSCISPFGRP